MKYLFWTLSLLVLCAWMPMPVRAVTACETAQLQQSLKLLEPSLGSYPPKFSSASEKKAVKTQYRKLRKQLDHCLKVAPTIERQYLRAQLYALGHNLDEKAAWETATREFLAVLSQDPKHSEASFGLAQLWLWSQPELAAHAEVLLRRGRCAVPAALTEKFDVGLFFALQLQGRSGEAYLQAMDLKMLWPDAENTKVLSELASEIIKARGIRLETIHPAPEKSCDFWTAQPLPNPRRSAVSPATVR